jgi:hypothetical protein
MWRTPSGHVTLQRSAHSNLGCAVVVAWCVHPPCLATQPRRPSNLLHGAAACAPGTRRGAVNRRPDVYVRIVPSCHW